MLHKILYSVSSIFQKLLGKLFTLLFARNNKMIALGCLVDKHNMFLHNTKYLFLYLSNIKSEYKTAWLTDNTQIIDTLKAYGYNNVYKRSSLQGMCFALRAKNWFYDYSPSAVANKCFSDNAVKVNLWHGTGGLKKCAADDKNFGIAKGSLQEKIYQSIKIKDSYYNVDSEREGAFRKSAFDAKDNQIVINGSPRLDVLYSDIPNAEMFMEEDFNNIKILKGQGKKLFFYVPTFRETKEDISGWLKSERLKQFLRENNSVLVCKLHPFDNNSLNFELSEEFYKMESNSDLYVVLKYMDAMISDYSSVYFDFLLLDRPIIYYVPDLEEYQEKCRGFYGPYESLTAGAKTRTEQELLNAMQDVVNGVDNYKQDRARLRNQTFKYQDGKNCERVVEWIRGLDK